MQGHCRRHAPSGYELMHYPLTLLDCHTHGLRADSVRLLYTIPHQAMCWRRDCYMPHSQSQPDTTGLYTSDSIIIISTKSPYYGALVRPSAACCGKNISCLFRKSLFLQKILVSSEPEIFVSSGILVCSGNPSWTNKDPWRNRENIYTTCNRWPKQSSVLDWV